MNSFWRNFARNHGAVVGLVILLLVIALAILAPVLYPGSPWDMVAAPFAPPGEMGMLLGSDSLGRDVAAGIAHGARVSLLVGAVSTVAALAIGVTLGAVAGYLGGMADEVVMRFTEFFQTIPSFVLAILLVAIFTPTIQSIVLAIAVVSWPPVARVVRAEFLSLRSREFVQAAEVLGKSRLAIVLGDILPNALSPIVVLSSLMVATAILLESALSFLGLGDPNMMSWGFLIGSGRSVIRIAWWMSVFPGIAIFLTVLSLNLVGEGLSDALNPRLARNRGGAA
ncbi:ABC transporter permease [Roseomonas sp. M0104]|uniref:ABC transporter permease n=1 Tax=Teichococcus coralli TaxID=2545983 RepID=A0A845B3L5_9PROT|nr:ABC transporter permease [Pseudoroseomonas coralli]MXP61791.1 ABC transporter permease [Pseudoroseomonas coralli]